ncbi:hypothetical protein GCM10011375_24970 [Hymenobacter qilianensis]|uniref:Uncharacterized protein n=2 Tax=Hymenobacter qilianensis TaxID=1385715 RepID=A0ACB5PSZ6_9BACT|nr:hypothetical protein [Hymenobacter qilianensis]QNP52580.1 hypothetical protein H9L05_02085 [Hymenobacter qilianensis]GGF68905.1 hypothetical protein GCM10011375_24970 [Hymenobacter qilianensis]
MQIFYHGTKSFPGSAYMSFAPAFRNQTDIRLNEPDLTRATANSNLGKSDQIVEVRATNGKDDPKLKVAEQEQQKEQQSSLATMIKKQEERGQKMRAQLMVSLNEAASEGWEVVQMSSYGDGGLVYLLRRAK